ncbi:hypothetical protein K1W54_21775 [Micromonospora sp. CPCC 205371]|nr:hypothetical protein [Micromonospora sp. CPCC 205371]
MSTAVTGIPATWQTKARRNLALVAIALTAVVTAAACGAGQEAETGRIVPAIPGADADAGPIALRDLLVPYREGGYPAGSTVPLVVRMFSTAEQPVTVTRVTVGPDDFTTVPATGVQVQPAGAKLVIPPEGYLMLTRDSGPYIAVEHIGGPLPYGRSLPVRFVFSTGDSVNIDVPMAPPDYPTK